MEVLLINKRYICWIEISGASLILGYVEQCLTNLIKIPLSILLWSRAFIGTRAFHQWRWPWGLLVQGFEFLFPCQKINGLNYRFDDCFACHHLLLFCMQMGVPERYFVRWLDWRHIMQHRYASYSRKCALQLPSFLYEPEDTHDPPQDVPCKWWELQGTAMVFSLEA